MNGGCDTPSSEPGTDLGMWDSDTEENPELASLYPPMYNTTTTDPNQILGFKKTHQRRSSDPSNTLNDFIRLGLLERPSGANVKVNISSTFGSTVGSLTASTENLDAGGEATCEILAGGKHSLA